MSETLTVDTSTVDYSTYFTGRVKWFNNKSGYGFITVIGNGTEFPEGVTDLVGTDIFSHHSFVVVEKEQFRYLVQGEYVSFKISTIESETHKYQATDVSGLNGGKLLCETREEQRSSRPRQQASRGRGPREEGDGEWTTQSKPKKRNYKPRTASSQQQQEA